MTDGIAARQMAESLRRAGHDVVRTSSGRETLWVAGVARPDLLVLDGALEDGDGFEVCHRLRVEHVETPVILLTNEDVLDERIRGLRIGADACVNRSLDLEELALRAATFLRHSPPLPNVLLRYRDVTLDVGAHQVVRDGRWINLDPTEFQLLHYLLRNLDVDMDGTSVVEHPWGEQHRSDSGLLASAVASLRAQADVGQPDLIHALRGIGFGMSDST